MSPLTKVDLEKQTAARICVKNEIRSGMRIGVGSGSTVKFFIEFLKTAYLSGEIVDIFCVPTSYQTREWLCEAQLPTKLLDQLNELDISIDGADEIDVNLTCIKGGGGCLLQEKLIQLCAKKFILIGDSAKYSTVLGTNCLRIPIEIIPYGCAPIKKWITEKVGGKCFLRMDQRGCFPSITENHNYILDWEFPKPIQENFDWVALNQSLISITGVVETGLFINVANIAYLGNFDGSVKTICRKTN